jgi:hypothetical protein
MSEVSETIEQMESEIKNAKVLAERRAMALKLHSNREFRKLILEEFMVQECARYVHMSASPQLTVEQRQDALNIAQAAGHLKRFLSVVVQMGEHAERTLPEAENELDKLRSEETV